MKLLLVGAATLMVAGCGAEASSRSEALPVAEVQVNDSKNEAASPEFLAIGSEVSAAQREVLTDEDTEIDSSAFREPVLTEAVTLDKEGEFRIPISLEIGTDPGGLGYATPKDFDEFVVASINLEVDVSKPISETNQASIVINVAEVREPYVDFKVWVY
jgi:hypothetical protein